MKKKDVLTVSISLLVLGALAGIVSMTSSLTANRDEKRAVSTQASSLCKCDNADKCYPDGCSRKPKTEQNTYIEARYDNVCGDSSIDPGYRMSDALILNFCSQQQPACCFDVYKYKDSRLCCWQERYACHPSLCEGSSGGEGCGWYWYLHGITGPYGCVTSDANGQPQPMWGLPPGLPNSQQPTNTPAPIIPTNTVAPAATITPNPQSTNKPTSAPVIPTQAAGQPTIIPTSVQVTQNNPQPTIGMVLEPSATPRLTLPPIEIKTPQEIAHEIINPESVSKLSEKTDKPLNAVKNGFNNMKQYDQKLESIINEYIFQLRIKLLELL